jgi:hypothetical protein
MPFPHNKGYGAASEVVGACFASRACQVTASTGARSSSAVAAERSTCKHRRQEARLV